MNKVYVGSVNNLDSSSVVHFICYDIHVLEEDEYNLFIDHDTFQVQTLRCFSNTNHPSSHYLFIANSDVYHFVLIATSKQEATSMIRKRFPLCTSTLSFDAEIPLVVSYSKNGKMYKKRYESKFIDIFQLEKYSPKPKQANTSESTKYNKIKLMPSITKKDTTNNTTNNTQDILVIDLQPVS